MDSGGIFSIAFLRQKKWLHTYLMEKPSPQCNIRLNFRFQTKTTFVSSSPFHHIVQNCTSILLNSTFLLSSMAILFIGWLMKMRVESLQSIHSFCLSITKCNLGISSNLSMTGIQFSRKKCLNGTKGRISRICMASSIVQKLENLKIMFIDYLQIQLLCILDLSPLLKLY